jgi:hypothetical protein
MGYPRFFWIINRVGLKQVYTRQEAGDNSILKLPVAGCLLLVASV